MTNRSVNDPSCMLEMITWCHGHIVDSQIGKIPTVHRRQNVVIGAEGKGEEAV